jgi:PBSX family phage terminase large subunit
VTFERFCPPELIRKHFQQDRIIMFRNGSEILYGGLGGDEDLERIKSTEFGWFAIDEATEVVEDMFMLLSSRLRWILPDGRSPRYTAFLASNPEPGWVKGKFVDRHIEGYAFIKALPRDNPYLPADYDAKLRKDWPDEWVRRYLDGSWDVFSGQVYKEFERGIHVYHEVEMGAWWERFRVIDHGYVNPTCCLWLAVDHDGSMWIYDEHYEAELTISENAKIIKAKHPEFDGTTICDPSMKSKTMQQGRKVWSPADEYRDNGIICLAAFSAHNVMSEAMGIQLVKQRLKSRSLFIHESCGNTIREMIAYKWRDLKSQKQDSRNLPEQAVDKNNHAMDCMRYACMWRPAGSRPPAAPEDTSTYGYAIKKHKQQLNQPFFAGWQ